MSVKLEKSILQESENTLYRNGYTNTIPLTLWKKTTEKYKQFLETHL